jgi:membrane associated rhomboid family serine protease
MATGPDLFVVCKKCGSEVSPYITECPYCGTRLRKRAPKIERGGRIVEPRPRRSPLPALGRLRPGEIPGIQADVSRKPWATGTLVVLSAVTLLLLVFVDRADLAVEAAYGSHWWRLFTAPFVYGNGWYELACLVAIALYGWRTERRYGPLVVIALFLLGGAGGFAVAGALDSSPFFSGGNGAALALLCAWAVPDLLARRRGEDYDGDLLGTLVIGLVIALMPLAVPEASWVAGFTGAAVGLLCGLLLERLSPQPR